MSDDNLPDWLEQANRSGMTEVQFNAERAKQSVDQMLESNQKLKQTFEGLGLALQAHFKQVRKLLKAQRGD
jgi:hypothetical protein